MKFKLYISVLLMNVCLSAGPEFTGGLSHSTSDNLDALTHNPAGMGIDRDGQFGLGLSLNDSSEVIFGLAFRHSALGALIQRLDDGELFYSISNGSLISPGIYSGFRWDSDQNVYSGILARPENWISLGLTHQYQLKDKKNGLFAGLAIRPFGSLLTIGSDIGFKDLNEIESNEISVFAQTNLANGIAIQAKYDLETESLQAGLSFNVNGLDIFSMGTRTDSRNSGHFMLRNYSHERPFLSLKKDTETLTYIEMTLDGTFIEEPLPDKKKFNFDIPDFNPFGGLIGGGEKQNYIQLHTWLQKMDQITRDESVDGLIIHYKGIRAGSSKLMNIFNSLMDFKNAGKKIIFYSNRLSTGSYLLASTADEIYMPELTDVDLVGFNVEIDFYKNLLDTLGITFEVEQISPYKSAMDPLIKTGLSPEFRENLSNLVGDIYDEFVAGISDARGWTIEETQTLIDNGPYRDDQAVDKRIITGTMYPDEFEKHTRKIDDKTVIKTPFSSISEDEKYVYEWKPSEDKIAIIYAVGGIQVGKSQRGRGPSTVMGNETINEAIKSARKDKNVKAIVLRIDSGGGSALSSDLMWREIYNTTVADTQNVKPFIASMSDVAASGGYYIACQADTIVAAPATVTGSIGVIAGRANFSKLKEMVGINTDGFKFGEHADFYSGSDLWTDEERKILRDGIEYVYGKFLNRVAGGRDELDSIAVHEVGVGKVWTGKRALELKLVDVLGSLKDAVKIAAEKAGLTEDEYSIEEYPKAKSHSVFKMGGKNGSITEFTLSGTLGEIQTRLRTIPDFENDQIQFVMPFQIIIK